MFKKLAILPCCLAAAALLAVVSGSGAADGRGLETEPAAEQIEQPAAPPAEVREEVQEAEEPPPALTLEAIRVVDFQDLPASECAAGCIRYAAYQGILSGVTEDRFDPDGLVSLASVLTALHRISGQAAPPYTLSLIHI